MDLFHARFDYILFGLFELHVMSLLGEIITKPADVIAIQGVEVVTFKCSTNSPLSIMWSFNNMSKKIDITFEGEIKPSQRSRYDSTVSQHDGVKEADLVMNKLDLDHAGTYICTDMEGVSDDSHSAQLTVLESNPLWKTSAVNNGTFTILSKFDYKGKLSPRITCVDADNNESISGSESITSIQNLVQNVQWTSVPLEKYPHDRIFKCSVMFCARDADCSSRKFEHVLTVNGLYPIGRNLKTAENFLWTRSTGDNSMDKYYVIIPCVIAFLILAVIGSVSTIRICVRRKDRKSAATNQDKDGRLLKSAQDV